MWKPRLQDLRKKSSTPRRSKRQRAVPSASQVRALEPRRLLAAPAGGEFAANTTMLIGTQTSDVAMDAAGNFVIVWSNADGSEDGIFGQRFSADGTPQGSEFQINTYTTNHQGSPVVVAMDADGDFVVGWTSHPEDLDSPETGQDGSSYGVYAQRFNAAGVAQGGEFRVNTTTVGIQSLTDIGMDDDGNFVVAWNTNGEDGSQYGVKAQRYDANGVAQGSEFQVNTTTFVDQTNASVAMDHGGNFVITWISRGGVGDPIDIADGIYGQRYNAAGVAQGAEFHINTYTTSDQSQPSVAMDDDGDFVVVWESTGQDGDFQGIYGQRFNAGGVAQGTEFRINTYTTGQQRLPKVAIDADGDFVVTWTDYALDGSNKGIFAREYDADGLPVADQFLVNSYTSFPQQFPRVAMDADGDFVITWMNNGTFDINAQRYLAEPPPVLNDLSLSIAENRPNGSFITDLDATNANPVSYAITGGNTGNAFAIDANTGVITVANSGPVNFEVNPVFTLTVTVTETGNPSATDSATITINLTDLNEAPTFLLPNTYTISENRPVGQFVGDVNAVDQEGNTITYSIVGGDPNAQFAIDASTGVITVAKATINFEATPQFQLQVRATDNGTPTNSRTQIFTVNINDLNEAPGFLPPTSFTISENRPVGYVVGTLNTSDPEGHAIMYSIVGGDPNAQFAINPTTGQITVAKATINFEATPQFQLQVRAQDNGSPSNGRTQTITVNINDLNEAPTFLPPTTFTIQENAPVTTLVGTVVTSDPEGQLVTYSIVGGNTNNAFSIGLLSGQIRVANRLALDFETTPQFVLQVRAQDNGDPANNRTQAITINLIDQAGARAAKSSDKSSPATSSELLGSQQQTLSNATATAPLRSAAPRRTDELYSFTLFEPIQAPTNSPE